jgi:polycomb protein EED
MYSRRKLKHWRRRKTELEKMGIGYNEGRYKLSSVARQDPADHVYCCALNSVSPNHADKLATTAGPRAYVYRLTSDGNMALMQCYVDEDLEEDYFACCWCASAIPGNEGAMLAVAGGYKGVVRVIDCTKEGVYVNLRGHGGGVNDVKAHPTSPHLLLTASKDESCRLWNMDSKVCIAVFAGALGHRNEVLSVDFKAGLDPYDAKEPADVVFVSGAMDNQIKVWSTDGYDGLIKQSDGWREDAGKKFPTAHVQNAELQLAQGARQLRGLRSVVRESDTEQERGAPHHAVPAGGSRGDQGERL